MLGFGTPTATLLSEYKKFTKDSSTANDTIGKTRIQHVYTQLAEETKNHIVDKTKYGDLKATQRSYLFPPDYIAGSLSSIRVKISDRWYLLDKTENNDLWALYATGTDQTSIPKLVRVMNNNGQYYIEFDPIPDANGTDNLEIIYRGYMDPLSFPSIHTTGTVSATNGSASITGSSSAFTSSMARQFLKVDGYKYWHEIKTFNSATSLTLVNNYQETTVAGATYQIAELMRLPSGINYAPVYGAAEIYWRPTNGKKADEYSAMYARELAMLNSKQSKTGGAIIRGRSVAPADYRIPRNYPKSSLTMS